MENRLDGLELVEDLGDSFAHLYELSRKCELEGKLDKALHFSQELAGKWPSEAFCWWRMGQLLLGLQSPFRAKAAFISALRIDKKCHPALCGLGKSLVALAKWRKAASAFRRAISIAEKHYLWMYLCEVLVELDHLDEANRVCDSCLRLKPGFSEALYNKACVLHLMGRDSEAILCLNDGVNANPGDADLLGLLKRLSGDCSEGH